MSGRTRRGLSSAELERILARGERLYRRFHAREPAQTVSRDVAPVPAVLVQLGVLEAVIYRARKHGDRSSTAYLHDFDGRRPLLCCDASGRQLWIVGGSYHIDWRGIVG